MSFLKISDPAKRDAIVKEYLDLKKNIQDNLLSQKTGELELQTDLSKFYRPITETQKATASEITEYILSPIWFKKKSRIIFPKKKEGYEGKGVVIIPSDPNALLERLDRLLASQEAGHTGVGNELVSICGN